MTLRPGRTLCHYRLVDKIGEGGMGVVWRAVDTELNREVALKFLPDSLANHAALMARFRREAKALAALNHPNIVTIHTVEEADGVRFLAMELIEGRTLAACIPEGGMPTDRLAELAVGMADALSTAVMVLGITEGLKLVERLNQVEALLVSKEMAVSASSGFPNLAPA